MDQHVQWKRRYTSTSRETERYWCSYWLTLLLLLGRLAQSFSWFKGEPNRSCTMSSICFFMSMEWIYITTSCIVLHTVFTTCNVCPNSHSFVITIREVDPCFNGKKKKRLPFKYEVVQQRQQSQTVKINNSNTSPLKIWGLRKEMDNSIDFIFIPSKIGLWCKFYWWTNR